MKAVNIQDARQKSPFVPFELFLDNGRSILVSHPDYLMFNPARTTLVVWEGEHYHIVDADHVSSLELRASKKPARRQPGD